MLPSFALDDNSPCPECEHREACEVWNNHLLLRDHAGGTQCLKIFSERSVHAG